MNNIEHHHNLTDSLENLWYLYFHHVYSCIFHTLNEIILKEFKHDKICYSSKNVISWWNNWSNMLHFYLNISFWLTFRLLYWVTFRFLFWFFFRLPYWFCDIFPYYIWILRNESDCMKWSKNLNITNISWFN